MSSIEYIRERVAELQAGLGSQLQVTIYNSALNAGDELIQAAKDVRMSVVTEGGGEWTPGKKGGSVYAVRVVAEGIGEIPYALMAEEIYLVGKSSQEAD